MPEYKCPERPVSMTVRHMYGISEAGEQKTVLDYLNANGFALTADLMAQGFKPAEIEEAVNSGNVAAAHWPAKEPKTDLYWSKDEATLRRLDKMAEDAVRFCYGQTESQPAGGNFATVGGEMGSQQLALVGLTYAREQGKLREFSEFDNGAGPLYVAKGGFSDKMFSALLG